MSKYYNYPVRLDKSFPAIVVLISKGYKTSYSYLYRSVEWQCIQANLQGDTEEYEALRQSGLVSNQPPCSGDREIAGLIRGLEEKDPMCNEENCGVDLMVAAGRLDEVMRLYQASDIPLHELLFVSVIMCQLECVKLFSPLVEAINIRNLVENSSARIKITRSLARTGCQPHHVTIPLLEEIFQVCYPPARDCLLIAIGLCDDVELFEWYLKRCSDVKHSYGSLAVTASISIIRYCVANGLVSRNLRVAIHNTGNPELIDLLGETQCS